MTMSPLPLAYKLQETFDKKLKEITPQEILEHDSLETTLNRNTYLLTREDLNDTKKDSILFEKKSLEEKPNNKKEAYKQKKEDFLQTDTYVAYKNQIKKTRNYLHIKGITGLAFSILGLYFFLKTGTQIKEYNELKNIK